jgi:2'-5' RNA ligase
MERFGIALCFDPETEAKLKALQDKLTFNGIKSTFPGPVTRPHVTLAAVRGGTLLELKEHLGVFVESASCLEVKPHSIGTYPPGDDDVFLTLTATPALRLFHQQCLASLGSTFTLCEDYHHPDRWAPHCTIGYFLADADIPRAIQLCRTSDIFHTSSLVELVIYGPPLGVEICSMKLGGMHGFAR